MCKSRCEVKTWYNNTLSHNISKVLKSSTILTKILFFSFLERSKYESRLHYLFLLLIKYKGDSQVHVLRKGGTAFLRLESYISHSTCMQFQNDMM